MKNSNETTMQANVNNNYKIIRDFLILNGIGQEYTDCDGGTRIDRSRTLDIEDFATLTVGGEVTIGLSYPTIVFSHKRGELDGEFVFHAENATYGMVRCLDVDDERAEIFAEAIKNGNICPLPIEKVDFDI